MRSPSFRSAVIIVIGSVFFLAACASYAVMSTRGSLWLLRTYLARKMHMSDIAFASAQGDLWHGVTLTDVHVRKFSLLGEDTDADIVHARIDVIRKRTPDQKLVTLTSVTLRSSRLFDSAKAEQLTLDTKNLVLDQVVIDRIAKIKGENRTAIRKVSFAFPVSQKSAMLAESVSTDTVLAKITSQSITGTVSLPVLQNVQIKDIRSLPPDEFVEMDKATVAKPYGWRQIRAIENGRVHLSLSDAILFYGTQNESGFDLHVFSKSADLAGMLTNISLFKGLTGSVSDVDLSVSGSLEDIKVLGSVHIDKLLYRSFSLQDAPITIPELHFKKTKTAYDILGEVRVAKGDIRHETIRLSLKPGKVVFTGDPEAPMLDLRATTVIADASIAIQMRGTPAKPDLSLSSDPAYNQEKILVMLATGKAWTGTDAALTEGRVSIEAAGEFLDYFLLGGTGDKLAKRFGIKEISVIANDTSKGVEVKTAVSKKLDVDVGIEKTRDETERAAFSKKVGVDYKAGKNTSVSVEGRLDPKTSTDELSTSDSANNKSVLMKLKRNF